MKVRVLHCLETIGTGGVEQRRLSLAKYLDKDHFEQHVVCSYVLADFHLKFQTLGVLVTAIGGLASLLNVAYYVRLIRVIRKFKPHIIHGAVFEGVISAVIGGFFCRVPVIVIEETSEPANRSWRGHFLLRLLSRFADAVVAISPAVYDYLLVDLHISPSKACLIINGVEPPSVPDEDSVTECRTRLGLRKNDFVIGCVGRLLDDHKLFSILIKGFKQFARVHENARLLLVGDGIDRLELEELVKTLGLQPKVIFAGHQRSVAIFYRAMNVFALVPAREGFGIAAVEAMFFKLPVIATRVGGLKQVVVHRETGLLLEPHDAHQVGDAMEYMFSHPSEAIGMGIAGYRRATESFAAKRYADDVNNLYERLIKSELDTL